MALPNSNASSNQPQTRQEIRNLGIQQVHNLSIDNVQNIKSPNKDTQQSLKQSIDSLNQTIKQLKDSVHQKNTRHSKDQSSKDTKTTQQFADTTSIYKIIKAWSEQSKNFEGEIKQQYKKFEEALEEQNQRDTVKFLKQINDSLKKQGKKSFSEKEIKTASFQAKNKTQTNNFAKIEKIAFESTEKDAQQLVEQLQKLKTAAANGSYQARNLIESLTEVDISELKSAKDILQKLNQQLANSGVSLDALGKKFQANSNKCNIWNRYMQQGFEKAKKLSSDYNKLNASVVNISKGFYDGANALNNFYKQWQPAIEKAARYRISLQTVSAASSDLIPGGAKQLDDMRRSMNLSMQQTVALAGSLKQLRGTRYGIGDLTSAMQGMKDTIGQVDLDKLEKLKGLMKSMPKNQMQTLKNAHTAKTEDTIDAIYTLQATGNIDNYLQLTASGAFGKQAAKAAGTNVKQQDANFIRNKKAVQTTKETALNKITQIAAPVTQYMPAVSLGIDTLNKSVDSIYSFLKTREYIKGVMQFLGGKSGIAKDVKKLLNIFGKKGGKGAINTVAGGVTTVAGGVTAGKVISVAGGGGTGNYQVANTGKVGNVTVYGTKAGTGNISVAPTTIPTTTGNISVSNAPNTGNIRVVNVPSTGNIMVSSTSTGAYSVSNTSNGSVGQISVSGSTVPTNNISLDGGVAQTSNNAVNNGINAVSSANGVRSAGKTRRYGARSRARLARMKGRRWRRVGGGIASTIGRIVAAEAIAQGTSALMSKFGADQGTADAVGNSVGVVGSQAVGQGVRYGAGKLFGQKGVQLTAKSVQVATKGTVDVAGKGAANTAGRGLLKGMGGAAGAGVLALAFQAYENYQEAKEMQYKQQSLESKFGIKTGDTSALEYTLNSWSDNAGKTIGVTAGAVIGAKAGAAIGTAIGGPIGTVVGLAIGTAVGALSAYVGSKIDEMRISEDQKKDRMYTEVAKNAKNQGKTQDVETFKQMLYQDQRLSKLTERNYKFLQKRAQRMAVLAQENTQVLERVSKDLNVIREKAIMQRSMAKMQNSYILGGNNKTYSEAKDKFVGASTKAFVKNMKDINTQKNKIRQDSSINGQMKLQLLAQLQEKQMEIRLKMIEDLQKMANFENIPTIIQNKLKQSLANIGINIGTTGYSYDTSFISDITSSIEASFSIFKTMQKQMGNNTIKLFDVQMANQQAVLSNVESLAKAPKTNEFTGIDLNNANFIIEGSDDGYNIQLRADARNKIGNIDIDQSQIDAYMKTLSTKAGETFQYDLTKGQIHGTDDESEKNAFFKACLSRLDELNQKGQTLTADQKKQKKFLEQIASGAADVLGENVVTDQIIQAIKLSRAGNSISRQASTRVTNFIKEGSNDGYDIIIDHQTLRGLGENSKDAILRAFKKLGKDIQVNWDGTLEIDGTANQTSKDKRLGQLNNLYQMQLSQGKFDEANDTKIALEALLKQMKKRGVLTKEAQRLLNDLDNQFNNAKNNQKPMDLQIVSQSGVSYNKKWNQLSETDFQNIVKNDTNFSKRLSQRGIIDQQGNVIKGKQKLAQYEYNQQKIRNTKRALIKQLEDSQKYKAFQKKNQGKYKTKQQLVQAYMEQRDQKDGLNAKQREKTNALTEKISQQTSSQSGKINDDMWQQILQNKDAYIKKYTAAIAVAKLKGEDTKDLQDRLKKIKGIKKDAAAGTRLDIARLLNQTAMQSVDSSIAISKEDRAILAYKQLQSGELSSINNASKFFIGEMQQVGSAFSDLCTKIEQFESILQKSGKIRLMVAKQQLAKSRSQVTQWSGGNTGAVAMQAYQAEMKRISVSKGLIQQSYNEIQQKLMPQLQEYKNKGAKDTLLKNAENFLSNAKVKTGTDNKSALDLMYEADDYIKTHGAQLSDEKLKQLQKQALQKVRDKYAGDNSKAAQSRMQGQLDYIKTYFENLKMISNLATNPQGVTLSLQKQKNDLIMQQVSALKNLVSTYQKTKQSLQSFVASVKQSSLQSRSKVLEASFSDSGQVIENFKNIVGESQKKYDQQIKMQQTDVANSLAYLQAAQAKYAQNQNEKNKKQLLKAESMYAASAGKLDDLKVEKMRAVAEKMTKAMDIVSNKFKTLTQAVQIQQQYAESVAGTTEQWYRLQNQKLSLMHNQIDAMRKLVNSEEFLQMSAQDQAKKKNQLSQMQLKYAQERILAQRTVFEKQLGAIVGGLQSQGAFMGVHNAAIFGVGHGVNQAGMAVQNTEKTVTGYSDRSALIKNNLFGEQKTPTVPQRWGMPGSVRDAVNAHKQVQGKDAQPNSGSKGNNGGNNSGDNGNNGNNGNNGGNKGNNGGNNSGNSGKNQPPKSSSYSSGNSSDGSSESKRESLNVLLNRGLKQIQNQYQLTLQKIDQEDNIDTVAQNSLNQRLGGALNRKALAFTDNQQADMTDPLTIEMGKAARKKREKQTVYWKRKIQQYARKGDIQGIKLAKGVIKKYDDQVELDTLTGGAYFAEKVKSGRFTLSEQQKAEAQERAKNYTPQQIIKLENKRKRDQAYKNALNVILNPNANKDLAALNRKALAFMNSQKQGFDDPLLIEKGKAAHQIAKRDYQLLLQKKKNGGLTKEQQQKLAQYDEDFKMNQLTGGAWFVQQVRSGKFNPSQLYKNQQAKNKQQARKQMQFKRNQQIVGNVNASIGNQLGDVMSPVGQTKQQRQHIIQFVDNQINSIKDKVKKGQLTQQQGNQQLQGLMQSRNKITQMQKISGMSDSDVLKSLLTYVIDIDEILKRGGMGFSGGAYGTALAAQAYTLQGKQQQTPSYNQSNNKVQKPYQDASNLKRNQKVLTSLQYRKKFLEDRKNELNNKLNDNSLSESQKEEIKKQLQMINAELTNKSPSTGLTLQQQINQARTRVQNGKQLTDLYKMQRGSSGPQHIQELNKQQMKTHIKSMSYDAKKQYLMNSQQRIQQARRQLNATDLTKEEKEGLQREINSIQSNSRTIFESLTGDDLKGMAIEKQRQFSDKRKQIKILKQQGKTNQANKLQQQLNDQQFWYSGVLQNNGINRQQIQKQANAYAVLQQSKQRIDQIDRQIQSIQQNANTRNGEKIYTQTQKRRLAELQKQRRQIDVIIRQVNPAQSNTASNADAGKSAPTKTEVPLTPQQIKRQREELMTEDNIYTTAVGQRRQRVSQDGANGFDIFSQKSNGQNATTSPFTPLGGSASGVAGMSASSNFTVVLQLDKQVLAKQVVTIIGEAVSSGKLNLKFTSDQGQRPSQ